MSADDPAKTAVDPSMDDILASIRRILNEEDAAPHSGSRPDGEDQRFGDDSEDVLTLDDAMLVEAPSPLPVHAEPLLPAASHLNPAVVEPPAIHLSTHSKPAPSSPSVKDVPAPAPATAPAELIANEAQDCAAASLGDLVRSLQAERHAAVYRGGPTIEDIVRAEIRPVLKTWLDTHLPGLVERLVRVEIERLAARAEV